MKKKSGKKRGAFSSTFVKSTDILLLCSDNPWQGRETDRQADNIHKVLPLRRHQCLNWTFYIWQRKRCGGKKNPNNNLCKKIFDGCSFSFHMDQNSAPLLNSNYTRARWRGNTQMIPLKLTFSEKVTPKRWEKNNSATKIWRRKEKKKKKWLRLPVKR